MNYAQAKLIANSPDCYEPEQWGKAAGVLLGRIQITEEDLHDGTTLASKLSAHNQAKFYD